MFPWYGFLSSLAPSQIKPSVLAMTVSVQSIFKLDTIQNF